jgi:hypothetical protein
MRDHTLQKATAMTRWLRLLAIGLALFAGSAGAAPSCAIGQTINLVVMSIKPLPPGRPWLQATNSSAHIALERCSYASQHKDGFCYFATNVPAGRYYFRQVMTNVMNDLSYRVSNASLWFDVSPVGMTYLGDWRVEFGDEGMVKRIEVRRNLSQLDRMQALCGWPQQRLFLARTKESLVEVVN